MSQALHIDNLRRDRVPSAGSIEADNLQHQTWRGYGLLATLLLVTAVTLLGCSSSPKMTAIDVSCDVISGKTFSGLFERSPENMAVYLDKAFATTVNEASQPITTTSGVVQESTYDWNSEIGAYQLSTFDRRPRYVHLTTGDGGPSLGRVIECLGAPTQYNSFRPWPGALDKMELTSIAPHLLPASGVESPVQSTRMP